MQYASVVACAYAGLTKAIPAVHFDVTLAEPASVPLLASSFCSECALRRVLIPNNDGTGLSSPS